MSKVTGANESERVAEAARLVVLDECIDAREWMDAKDWSEWIITALDKGKTMTLEAYALAVLQERVEMAVADRQCELDMIERGEIDVNDGLDYDVQHPWDGIEATCFGEFDEELWDDAKQLLGFGPEQEKKHVQDSVAAVRGTGRSAEQPELPPAAGE